MDRPPWWTGEDSWLPKHSLLCGGCKDSIDEFWLKSGKDPTSKRVLPWQHQSPPMLDVRMGQQNSASELSQSSYNKERSQRDKDHSHRKTKALILKEKREAQQQRLPQVNCGKDPVKNCWSFVYLGSIRQPDRWWPDVWREKANHNDKIEIRQATTHSAIGGFGVGTDCESASISQDADQSSCMDQKSGSATRPRAK